VDFYRLECLWKCSTSADLPFRSKRVQPESLKPTILCHDSCPNVDPKKFNYDSNQSHKRFQQK
jgi:hypothetical protein